MQDSFVLLAFYNFVVVNTFVWPVVVSYEQYVTYGPDNGLGPAVVPIRVLTLNSILLAAGETGIVDIVDLDIQVILGLISVDGAYSLKLKSISLQYNW